MQARARGRSALSPLRLSRARVGGFLRSVDEHVGAQLAVAGSDAVVLEVGDTVGCEHVLVDEEVPGGVCGGGGEYLIRCAGVDRRGAGRLYLVLAPAPVLDCRRRFPR